MKDFSSKSILIGSYVRIAYAEDIEKYCKSRFAKVGFIGIVNPYTSAAARLTLSKGDKELLNRPMPSFNVNMRFYALLFPFVYLAQLIEMLVAALILRQRFDYYLGVGYWSAYVGCIMKKLGMVDKVIYYVYDYFPTNDTDPFRIKLIHAIFRFLDAQTARMADALWCLAEPLAAFQRKKGLDKPILIVPLGISTKSMKLTAGKPTNKEVRLVSVGILKENQGLDILLKALKDKSCEHISFDIIGNGQFRPTLEALVKEYKLEKRVTLHGFVDDNQLFDKLIGQSHFGIALFHNEQDDFMLYTDTGKVKLYFAFGLPVIASNRFVIAKDIERLKLGYAVETEAAKLSQFLAGLSNISTNEYETIKKNVQEYRSDLSWEKVFDNALTTTFSTKKAEGKGERAAAKA